MTATTVTAVVVSYNVRDLLLACITSLECAREEGALTEIIVVDNASTDGSAPAVREQFPNVKVIEHENRGYGAGANKGFKESTSEYVLVLNPDTTVPASTVRVLAEHMERNHACGVAAPRLQYPDGSLQPSRRRFPRRLTPLFESTVLEQWWPGNPWVRHYRMSDSEDESSKTVDWVVGAALLIRRSAIERAGGFDEAFWMYCEETELCWRFRKHGWVTCYRPDVEITHHEGASSSQDVWRRQIAFDRSRVELQRRIYGNATANLAALGIRAGYLLHLIAESSKYILGHKRDLRRDRLTYYARLLTTSLRFIPGRPA